MVPSTLEIVWLKVSIWVLIVSRHDQYVDCTILEAHSPPAYEFAMRLIFVASLCNHAKFVEKLSGFR